MKVRKRLLKQVAKIYAANLIVNAMGSGAESDLLLNEDEYGYMQDELHAIAKRISNEPARTLDECIEIVIANTQTP